jgi:hypothetical protein
MIERTITLRDTTIVIEGASVSTTFDCDSLVRALSTFEGPSKVIRKQNKQASITIQADSAGRLSLTANCDDLERQLQLRDERIHELQRRHERSTETILVPFCPPWKDGLALIGALALVAILFMLIYTIRK